MEKGNHGNYLVDDDYEESSKLLRTIPPGISARTHSISGTKSIYREDPKEYRARWWSIRVMYLTMFLSSVSFSICMSSLYPYLQILDPKATTDFLGWVVAAYSLGQLVASPVFGAWANMRNKSREPLIASLVVNILANILYMYLEGIHNNSKIFMILARALVGFGAGNVAVVRSYVSGATTLEERTSAMANMSAFQAIGFIIGPLIQTALVPLGYPGLVHKPSFYLNMYTSTAFLSAIVGVVNIVLLIVVLKEFRVKDDLCTEESVQYRSIEITPEEHDVQPLDYVAVISCIALFFSVLFVFAVFETIATPLSMHMFSWTKSEATLYIGLMLGVAGIVSILVFAVIKVLSKRQSRSYNNRAFKRPDCRTDTRSKSFYPRTIEEWNTLPTSCVSAQSLESFKAQLQKVFSERYLLFGGFVFCLLGFFVYLPWGHHYPDIQDAIITPDSIQNITGNTTSHESTGCPYVYKWCLTTPAIRFWQFVLGTFFVAIGYPTCNVMSYTIYSKVLGPKPQGIWMGWLTAAGSLARTLGPIFVSNVYDATGPRVTFAAILGMITVTIIGLFIAFRRLVPYAKSSTIIVKSGNNNT